jgi:uncharacterized protein YqcC (DUF446 family)
VDKFTHQLADLILAIEAEMRRLNMWEAQPPDSEALESLAPFCHDTLRFEQWLQWVFLAKMKQVLETEEGFPASSDIAPLAELRFEQLPQQTGQLLALIKQFDEFINRHH